MFLAQSLGYWPDVDNYYTRGRKVLKFDKLEGSSGEIQQMMRILLTAAYVAFPRAWPPHDVSSDLQVLQKIYTTGDRATRVRNHQCFGGDEADLGCISNR